jgi:hypothetical protein
LIVPVVPASATPQSDIVADRAWPLARVEDDVGRNIAARHREVERRERQPSPLQIERQVDIRDRHAARFQCVDMPDQIGIEDTHLLDRQIGIGQQLLRRRPGRGGGGERALRLDNVRIVADEHRGIDHIERARAQVRIEMHAIAVRHRQAPGQVALADEPLHAREAIDVAGLHPSRLDVVAPRFGQDDVDDPEQLGDVAAARARGERHVLDLGDRRQRPRNVDHVVRRPGAPGELVLTAVGGRVGRQKLRRDAERRRAEHPLAREADRLADPRVGRADVVDREIGAQAHARVEVTHRRAPHRRDIDARKFERLAALLLAERPRIGGMALVPFQIDRTVHQIEPVEPALAEEQRQRRDPRIDPLAAEQVWPGRPGGVREGEAFGVEFDLERGEVELEVAADAHLAAGEPPDDGLERPLQEASLGDVQHQPDQRRDRDDRDDRVTDDSPPALSPRVRHGQVRRRRGLFVTLSH